MTTMLAPAALHAAEFLHQASQTVDAGADLRLVARGQETHENQSMATRAARCDVDRSRAVTPAPRPGCGRTPWRASRSQFWRAATGARTRPMVPRCASSPART